MLLLGVADCCWIVHRFAFAGFSVLLIPITFCFDLPALASFKRQTNGKNFVFLKPLISSDRDDRAGV
jgi:hypothetical protein